jgi:predicted nuclease of predicted toxin-antitoxin system
MRILLDMNVSPLWVDLLVPHAHDVLHWSKVGSSNETDVNIMAWAQAKGYVVMTNDLDFGEVLAITHRQKPSVIQLRDGRNDPVKMLPTLIAALSTCSRELEEGALISIDHARPRLKLLPLKADI